MTEHNDQREPETVEAARHRADAEIARVTMDTAAEHRWSRYSPNTSVPTTPTGMISKWATSSTGGDQQGTAAPAVGHSDDKPDPQAREHRD